MEEKGKAQIADEIMQAMIDKYSKKDTNIKNVTLELFYRVREKVNQNDEEIISRVIEFYGPEVKKLNQKAKLKTFSGFNLIKYIKDKVHKVKQEECTDVSACKDCQEKSNCFIERNR